MKLKTCGLLAVLSLLGGSNVLSTPIARLTLVSQPGDFIGQGGTFDITYTPGHGLFDFSAQITNTLPDESPGEVTFVLGTTTQALDTNTFAILIFGTEALGIQMQPGIYTNAEPSQAADPGHPGLDISFQNRGCNDELPVSNIGSFVVTDASFESSPPFSTTISSFSASFEYHCVGSTDSLSGTFTYNANAPTPVPEPAAYWLLGIGFVLIACGAGAKLHFI